MKEYNPEIDLWWSRFLLMGEFDMIGGVLLDNQTHLSDELVLCLPLGFIFGR